MRQVNQAFNLIHPSSLRPSSLPCCRVCSSVTLAPKLTCPLRFDWKRRARLRPIRLEARLLVAVSCFMTVSVKSRKGQTAPDLSDFRRRYPLTVASFGALANREAWLRRIWELDARWQHQMTPWGSREQAQTESIVRGAPPANLPIEAEFEVIYAGGVFGLLHASLMASRHHRRVM